MGLINKQNQEKNVHSEVTRGCTVFVENTALNLTINRRQDHQTKGVGFGLVLFFFYLFSFLKSIRIKSIRLCLIYSLYLGIFS